MFKTLCIVLLIAVSVHSAEIVSSGDHTSATTWANTWQAGFTEKTSALFSLTTKGNWWFDYTNKKFRVDRENGKLDRYCGSIYKLSNTKCNQVVREGKRYMYFPDKKFCCMCCTDAQGCGVIKPEFVKLGVANGRDDQEKTEAYKYLIQGNQPNYYWESADNKPLRFQQVPLSDMAWDSNYSEEAIDSSVFDLPTDMGDCEQKCGYLTVCNAL